MNEFDLGQENSPRKEILRDPAIAAYRLARERGVPRVEAAMIAQPITQGHDAIRSEVELTQRYKKTNPVSRVLFGQTDQYAAELAYAGAINNVGLDTVVSAFENTRRENKTRKLDSGMTGLASDVSALELSGYSQDRLNQDLVELRRSPLLRGVTQETVVSLLSAAALSDVQTVMERLTEVKTGSKFADPQTPAFLVLAGVMTGETTTQLMDRFRDLRNNPDAKAAGLHKFSDQTKAIMVLIGALGRLSTQELARDYSDLRKEKDTKDVALWLMLAVASEKAKAAVVCRHEEIYHNVVGAIGYVEDRFTVVGLKKPGSY